MKSHFERILYFETFALISRSKLLLDTGYCEPGWKLYNNKCYLIRYGTFNRLKFEDAQRYCKQWKDGNLVSIHKRYDKYCKHKCVCLPIFE